MTAMKKLCVLAIVLALVMALASCSVLDEILAASQGAGNVTETPDDKTTTSHPQAVIKRITPTKKKRKMTISPHQAATKMRKTRKKGRISNCSWLASAHFLAHWCSAAVPPSLWVIFWSFPW